MREILLWMAAHQTLLVIGGFALAQVVFLILLAVTARRVRTMKREMDRVGEQVQNYLNIVLENEEEELTKECSSEIPHIKKDEEENLLISTVLQEIFP